MQRRQFLISTVTATAAVALVPAVAFAASQINIQKGYAVKGYDTVAFFTQGKPVKGKDAHQTSYKGAKWRFSSAENLALFKTNPTKYAPQFGGYCAYAVSKGYTANGDPEAWTIHKGKLYLNINKIVRGLWRAQIESRIAKGNTNWPKVLG